MHNATTKQRLSALRRKLGVLRDAPRWVRERGARLEAAATSVLGLGQTVARAAEATPAPALARATRALATTLPDAGTSSGRWVSDSMIVGETGNAWPAPTERVATADLPTVPDGLEPQGSAAAERPRTSPWRALAALAALALAVAGLLLGLRPRAPAAADRAAVAAPAPAAPLAAQGAAPAQAAAPAPTPGPAAAEPPAMPAPAPIVVRRGDTLWALAAVHLGDPLSWPRLHAANRDRIRDPDLIYPGQPLGLPAR